MNQRGRPATCNEDWIHELEPLTRPTDPRFRSVEKTWQVFVDALQGTYTSAIARYALAALPATIALFGGVLAAFPGRRPAAWIVALAVVWAAAMVPFVRGTSRAGEPFEAAALAAAERVGTDGLVLVHGIPSSVVGMAHYMPDSTPVAAWVGQLGERRMPDDLIRLVQDRDTVALADMHSVGEPMPQKPWLERHRRLFRTSPFQDATFYYFAPVSDSTRR